MKVSIEKAGKGHLRAIQNLNLLLFKKEKKDYDNVLNLNWTFGKEGTKYFKEKITKPSSCTLLALANGKVVGYLAGGLVKEKWYDVKSAELENMFVLKDYRKMGIGLKLYAAFKKWCRL